MSEETGECIDCHASLHPGVVAAWKKSRHARWSPAQGLKKMKLERRVSAEKIPDTFANSAVGCAECHTMRPERHKDSFDHNGHNVHIVVSPEDCKVCHTVETQQYNENIMSHAYGNLQNNPVYRDLIDSATGTQFFKQGKAVHKKPDIETDADACFFCHGTVVRVRAMSVRDTVEGEMTFPVLSGWPNRGVGRMNPDGSKGSCTACHARHEFSMETARKPQTCAECHKGPDVPAYSVYSVSKHGNLYSARGSEWDFKAVPWTIGKDFTSPTCASCHMSLVVTEEGEVVTERTHRMSDRLPWRIFGLIYSHVHPISPDTTIIRNKQGLPLPTSLDGEQAETYLIDEKEQKKRLQAMKEICLSCHGRGWVDGQFKRLKNSIKTSDQMTLTATKVMQSAWEKGLAKGLDRKDSIFNEAIERKWVEQWLFYANSTRFASAMMGADYGVFANGRWHMSKNIQEMLDWVEFKSR
ncbi:MAG: multiheme c-type cytochrome, partial [Thermodesulfobacteriota bacterium]|nr:multiheme c-type cytochrome [Thermodesulfobacteriota bacterium]